MLPPSSLPVADDGDDSNSVIALEGSVLTAADEQRKWLQEAMNNVQSSTTAMQQQIAAGNFQAAIGCAACMLNELRTNLLEPQHYYELYMKVFGDLQILATYFEETYRAKRRTLEEIYEEAQYIGFIVPRLYLLITAGAVYINSGEQPALEIARDLVEMSKGVQHPTRGLFLRHYLLTMMKNKLPGDANRVMPAPVVQKAATDPATAPSAADVDGGTVTDTAALLVQNFKEMNWLWIRMEARNYVDRNGGSSNSVSAVAVAARRADPAATGVATSGSGSPTSPTTRAAAVPLRSLQSVRQTKQERRAMCVLIGMNLVRISQLEGIGRDVYAESILPDLLTIIVRYREPLAQQYLLEVLIQVFPDEFHLFTIEQLIDAVCRTVRGVDVALLMQSLVARLGKYASEVRDGITAAGSAEEAERLRDVFYTLLDPIEQIKVSYRVEPEEERLIKRTASTPPPTPMMLSVFVAVVQQMMQLAVTLYADDPVQRSTALSRAIQIVAIKFSSRGSSAAGTEEEAEPHPVPLSPAASQAAIHLLILLITEFCETIHEALRMDGIGTLLSCLPFLGRRAVAVAVCEAALNGSTAAPLLPPVVKATPLSSTQRSTAALPPQARLITSLDDVARLFGLIDVLLVDQDDAPADLTTVYRFNPAEEFAEEQRLVCRVLHLLHHRDAAIYFKMLTGVRKLLSQGGPKRLPLTCPTLIILLRRAALRCSKAVEAVDRALQQTGTTKKDEEINEEEAEVEGHGGGGGGAISTVVGPQMELRAAMQQRVRKCFSYLFSGDGIGLLEVAVMDAPSRAIAEYLSCAATADVCHEAEVCYSLYTEAFTIYEEQVAQSADQITAMTSFINSLSQLRYTSPESYDVLSTKVCQYCSKLLRKQDQSLLIALCANLFVQQHLSSECHERVRECLRRSMKLAHQVVALPQLHLYVELLSIFLHLYTAKTSFLAPLELINDLLDRIRDASEALREPGGSESNKDDEPAGNDGSSSTAEASKTAAAATAALDDSANVIKGGSQYSGSTLSFDEVRLVYRNTAKYIRSRQAVDEEWRSIEV